MTTLQNAQPVHFYHPQHGQHDDSMQSPEYVQLSTAAAITLGLMQGQMHRTPCTHCLNLLVTYPEGCRANCAYCGLARHREEDRAYADRNFIRVDWPTVRYEDVIARVAAGGDRGAFQRMCISMITHPKSGDDTITLLDQWVARVPHVPVSILSNPSTMSYEDLEDLKRRGAEIFTVALDAVTPEIFEQTRGKAVQSPHTFARYWQALEWAAEIYGPEKFGAHLICGMGETEQDMLLLCQKIKDMGGHSHMFAFFPEQGSLMENTPAVPRDHWRRVQLGRYLIDYAGGRVENMGFDSLGRITDFGIPNDQLQAVIAQGTAFRTSGCPGNGDESVSACNRPYGDSTPLDIYSFPFALDSDDVDIVRRQMHGEDIGTYLPNEWDESA